MSRARRAAILAAAAALAVALLAFVTYDAWLTALVRAAAARRGVELSFSSAQVSGTKVRLVGITAALAGVRGVGIRADEATVFVSGLSISRVDVQRPVITVSELDLDGLRAAARRGGGDGARLYARDATATWGAATARGVDVDHDPVAGGKLTAREVTLPGAPATGAELSWTVSGDETTVRVPGRLEARLRLPERGAGSAAFTFPEQSIAAWTGGRHPQARASGALTLSVPEGAGVTTGELTARVDGVRPSVGREAAGLVGAQTDVSATISAPAGAPASLTSLKLTNGALALVGRGEVSRAGHLRAALDGAVPCSTAASSAAGGGLIGGLVGRAVGAALGGNIAVHLAVDADATNPGAASVTPTVRVGCGL